MAKVYKSGNSVAFTATLNAAYDGDKAASPSNTSSSETVVDVAAAVIDDLEPLEKQTTE
jgi:hypothetical protein